MRVLLDTHLLVWLAVEPERIPKRARSFLSLPDHSYLFSVSSIWEVAIKHSLKKPNFQVDAGLLREGLLAGGMEELSMHGAHAIAVGQLPLLHRDPFDRLLIAQAIVERVTLATVDRDLAAYSPSVKYVG